MRKKSPVFFCVLILISILVFTMVTGMAIQEVQEVQECKEEPETPSEPAPAETPSEATPPETPPEAAQEIVEAGPQCLDCHGPYDDLAKATAEFTMPSGEIATPHQYIPHDEKVEKNIPPCTECHTKHEIPMLDKSTVAKPDNVDYCYQNCHHVYNFQPCYSCH